jgi:hypothetical protein
VHWGGGEIVNNTLRQSMSWPAPPRVLLQFATPDSDHEKPQWIRSDIVDIAIAFTCRNPETYRSISAAAPRNAVPHRRDNSSIARDGRDNSDEH